MSPHMTDFVYWSVSCFPAWVLGLKLRSLGTLVPEISFQLLRQDFKPSLSPVLFPLVSEMGYQLVFLDTIPSPLRMLPADPSEQTLSKGYLSPETNPPYTAPLGKGKSSLGRGTPALLLLLLLSGVPNSCLLFCLLSSGMFSWEVDYCHFPTEIGQKTEERGKRSIHSIYGLLIRAHLETQAYFFRSASSPQVFAGSAHISVHLIVRILFRGVSVSTFSVSRGYGPCLRSTPSRSTFQVPHSDVCYYTFLSFQWSQKRTWKHVHIKLLPSPTPQWVFSSTIDLLP